MRWRKCFVSLVDFQCVFADVCLNWFTACRRLHAVLMITTLFHLSQFSMISKIQIIRTQFWTSHLAQSTNALTAYFHIFAHSWSFSLTKLSICVDRPRRQICRPFNEVKQWTIFINSVCKCNERSSNKKKPVSDYKFGCKIRN